MADHHQEVLRAHGYHPLRVKEVVQETADTRTFVLDVPADLRAAFTYQPGQFCTFRVHLDVGEQLRSYSMSSAPETDPDLAVTVKRVPGGLVSNWFHDEVLQGDVLEVTRPAGVFCPRERDTPVVAFCGGSGVTPVMSIAKSVLAGTQRSVRILYANRDRPSVIFDQALGDLTRRHGERLEVQHHLDCDGGFLEGPAIAHFAAGKPEADFYVCGPGPFMDLVESTLLEHRVGPDHILIERFNVEEAAPLRPAAAPAKETVTRSVTVSINRATATVAYQPGDTLLEVARRAGLQPPFSCEAGNCATCMAFLKEGEARMRVNNALTPEEVDEGWVLTCQALPTSQTVTVEYESI